MSTTTIAAATTSASATTERYARVIEISRRVRWEIERDVFRGRRFDYGKTFLPSGLSLVNELPFLSPADKRLLSQVQGAELGLLEQLPEALATGQLGLGGGMMMVPFLTFILTARDYPAQHVIKMAIATSLATICFTSLASVRAHHRRGAVVDHQVLDEQDGVAAAVPGRAARLRLVVGAAQVGGDHGWVVPDLLR